MGGVGILSPLVDLGDGDVGLVFLPEVAGVEENCAFVGERVFEAASFFVLEAEVLGSPQEQRQPLLERVEAAFGSLFEIDSFDDRVKVSEVVETFAALYPDPVDGSTLLERLGLSEKADTRYARLSGVSSSVSRSPSLSSAGPVR